MPDAGRSLDLGRPDHPVALRGCTTRGSWRARAADRDPVRRALERAFGTFCANVADGLPAILAAPEYVDRVANAIVEAIAPLIEDFAVARRAARAAIEALLAGKAVQS
jgi:hypothetical protein